MVMNTQKQDVPKCKNCGKLGHTVEQCWACKKCGKPGHVYDECWHVVGFPPGYDRGKKKEKGRMDFNKEKGNNPKGQSGKPNQRWNKSKQAGRRMAGNVKLEPEEGTSTGSTKGITAHQLEQILKMLPSLSTEGTQGVGQVELLNDLKLENVMYIPTFKQNLISVQKLSHDANCRVMFMPKYCITLEEGTSRVKGVGKEEKELYYLLSETVPELLKTIKTEIIQEPGVMRKEE
ncbi:Gag-Pol polyprotein, partial [Bienertia sinuspersici]